MMQQYSIHLNIMFQIAQKYSRTVFLRQNVHCLFPVCLITKSHLQLIKLNI